MVNSTDTWQRKLNNPGKMKPPTKFPSVINKFKWLFRWPHPLRPSINHKIVLLPHSTLIVLFLASGCCWPPNRRKQFKQIEGNLGNILCTIRQETRERHVSAAAAHPSKPFMIPQIDNLLRMRMNDISVSQQQQRSFNVTTHPKSSSRVP